MSRKKIEKKQSKSPAGGKESVMEKNCRSGTGKFLALSGKSDTEDCELVMCANR